MKPTDRLHLLADVRDLQIVDCNEENCGIVDDLELAGKPGGKLEVKAILVGPGAYRDRLPGWLAWLIVKVAGNDIVRVPWEDVRSIRSVIQLERSAAELGLGRADRRLAARMPNLGVMDAAG